MPGSTGDPQLAKLVTGHRRSATDPTNGRNHAGLHATTVGTVASLRELVLRCLGQEWATLGVEPSGSVHLGLVRVRMGLLGLHG